MTRIFKVAFCVLTLCGAATLAGCGEADTAKPADTSADTPAETTDAADESGEGSESK